MKIATFKFGIIADFVTGVRLSYGEKAELLREKASKQYQIPYSNSSRLSEATIKKWILDYKKAGNRIEGLMPKDRKDKGVYRSLDISIQMAIKEIKKEKDHLTGIALIEELKHRKYLAPNETLNLSVLYRFLRENNLKRPDKSNKDRRAFEVQLPNQVWQSDVMHGPYITTKSKKKKTYLIAIIDDHSRLIVHAQFYLSETLGDFKDCLKQAIEKRGIPAKLYIDNGSCYRAINLDQIAAILGIGITHTPPYTPQGRGKIERWFRYVRENFLAINNSLETLDDLNELFSNWVEEYHNKVHSITKETPLNRYKKNMKCVRPAPKDLLNYFRLIQFRRVKKDRTLQLNGNIFEVPVELVDLKIEVRYHAESPEKVELFYDGKSYGNADLVNKSVNAKVGRVQTHNEIEPSELFN